MTERERKKAVERLRWLIINGTIRKQAILAVLSELRATGRPCSRASLYVWCRKYQVSLA